MVNATEFDENEVDEVMDEEDESDEKDNVSSDEDDASNVKTNPVETKVHAKKPVNSCTYLNFVEVVEQMLTFHAWYKEKKAIRWDETTYDTILKSIRKMLALVKKTLPRKEGQKWCIQKFHELLHVPIDVQNFGSPKNFDTGIMEK